MILDSTLFLTAAAGDLITAGAASSGVVDLLGMGSGNASTNRWGTPAVFGQDLGIGPGAAMPMLGNYINTTFAPGTASLNIQLQGAPDNGSNQPGTWVTYAESGPIVGTALVAPAKVFPIDLPARLLTTNPLPRFLRLNYAVTSGPFTGGRIFSGILLTRDDFVAYPANYVIV